MSLDTQHERCDGCKKVVTKGQLNKYNLCRSCYQKMNNDWKTYQRVKKVVEK